MSDTCFLNDPKWRQCCCACKYHVATRKFTTDVLGYACTVWMDATKELEIIINFPEHSIGCELFEKRIGDG